MAALALLGQLAAASFYFQDNSYVGVLRLCNTSICENLPDGNSSTISNASTAYEVRHDRISPSGNALWGLVSANFGGVALVILALCAVGLVVRWSRKK